MSDLVERLTTKLEPILASEDPRPALSAYHDMSYVLLCYDPQEELELRCEVGMLRTRLEQGGKRVFSISLAECMQKVVDPAQSPVRRSLCCVWSLRAERLLGAACHGPRLVPRPPLVRRLCFCRQGAIHHDGFSLAVAGPLGAPEISQHAYGCRLPPRAIGGAVEEPLTTSRTSLRR